MNRDFTTKAAIYEVPGSGKSLPVKAPNFDITEISQMKNVISKSLSD